MVYGKPVSKKRRRPPGTQSTSSPSLLAAARKLTKRAALCNAVHRNDNKEDDFGTPTRTSNYLQSSLHSSPRNLLHKLKPLASPSLLGPGFGEGVWPLRERLVLASALLDTENQQLTWPTISRRLSKFTPPSWAGSLASLRPKTWCAARPCAKQYSLLLESVELVKRQQQAEQDELQLTTPTIQPLEGGMSLVETLVKRLTVERVEELRQLIIDTQQYHKFLTKKIVEVENGDLDEHLASIYARLQTPSLDQRLNSEEADSVEDAFIKNLFRWQDPFSLTPSNVWTAIGGAVPTRVANLVGGPQGTRESTASTTPMKNQQFSADYKKLPTYIKKQTHGRSYQAEVMSLRADEYSNDVNDMEGVTNKMSPSSTPSTSVMSDSDREELAEDIEDEEDGDTGIDISGLTKVEQIDPEDVMSENVPESNENEECKDEAEEGENMKENKKITPARISSPLKSKSITTRSRNTSKSSSCHRSALGSPCSTDEGDPTHPHRSLRLRLSRQNGNMTVCSLGDDSVDVEGDKEEEENQWRSPPLPSQRSPTELRLQLNLSPNPVNNSKKDEMKQWSTEMLNIFSSPAKPSNKEDSDTRRRSSSNDSQDDHDADYDNQLFFAAKQLIESAEADVSPTDAGRDVLVHKILFRLSRATVLGDEQVLPSHLAHAIYFRLAHLLNQPVGMVTNHPFSIFSHQSSSSSTLISSPTTSLSTTTSSLKQQNLLAYFEPKMK